MLHVNGPVSVVHAFQLAMGSLHWKSLPFGVHSVLPVAWPIDGTPGMPVAWLSGISGDMNLVEKLLSSF